VSFFDIDKPESAISKWSRAGTRAAMVIFYFNYANCSKYSAWLCELPCLNIFILFGFRLVKVYQGMKRLES
jgi:hypothetical protein